MFSWDATKIPIVGKIVKTFDSAEVEYGYIAMGAGAVILFIFFTNTDYTFGTLFSLLIFTAPLWLPYITVHTFHYKWMEFVHKKYDVGNGRTSLEIRLPPEVSKSPKAMESVLNQMWNRTSPDNLWETYIMGKWPPRYGLEIFSNQGEGRPSTFAQSFCKCQQSHHDMALHCHLA